MGVNLPGIAHEPFSALIGPKNNGHRFTFDRDSWLSNQHLTLKSHSQQKEHYYQKYIFHNIPNKKPSLNQMHAFQKGPVLIIKHFQNDSYRGVISTVINSKSNTT